MSLAVCVFITWCLILILALLPKKLTEPELFFLFFVCTIFELSIFTVVHLNLHWIEVNRSVETSLADLVLRLFFFPILLVIAANVLLYSSKFLRWGFVVAVLLLGLLMQKVVVGLGILTAARWNAGYTILMYGSYLAFTRLMTWFIRRMAQREGDTV